MMSSKDEEGPDSSSIKPVSSLRSRFENLNTVTAPRSQTPAPSTSRQSTLTAYEEGDRPRTSLDLPRRSLWNPSVETHSAKGTPGRTALDQQDSIQRRQPDPGRAQQHRPVSMGIWSRPSSPPMVTLQSPVSPPKPLLGDSARAGYHSPTRSAFDIRPKPHVNSPTSPSPREVTPPRAAKPPQEVEPVHRPAAPSPLANVKVPPPVNRARKPATPTVASFATPSLEPKRPIKADETSPFTTPPSSDESPWKESSNLAPQVPIATRPITSGPDTKPTSYFPPPPVHHAVEAQRRGSDSATAKQLGHRRMRTGSVDTVKAFQYGDFPEQRPNLPARKNESPIRGESRLMPDSSRGQLDTQRKRAPSPAPPRPSEESKGGFRKSFDQRRPSPQDLLPPTPRSVEPAAHSPSRPTRSYDSQMTAVSGRLAAPLPHAHEAAFEQPLVMPSNEYPDASVTNRRPPKSKYGTPQVYPNYDARAVDMCGDHVVTIGHYIQAWDLKSGRVVIDMNHEEGTAKITAVAFKPGASTEQEGQYLWTGNKNGEMQEIDIKHREVTYVKPGAHNYREIVQIHRYENSMLSIDEDGKLHLWPPNERGLPSLGIAPLSFRVSRGHSFSVMVQKRLWFAAGRLIHVYEPFNGDNFHVTTQPLMQPGVGEVTTGAVVSNQLEKVYFGHSDGKISIYSAASLACIGIISVSSYKINCLSGAGDYLWAGFSTGVIYVYDTHSLPWKTKKEWVAHQGPVAKLVTDRSSVWKLGHLQVASLGLDNTIRLWDGLLEDDLLEADIQDRDIEYCNFREIKTVVVTWNAGASSPGSLRYDQKDANFFRETIQAKDPPDILVFGFQELVDLEDKKLTAKSFFKGSKKKESDHEHIGRQYRAWRDFLARMIEDEVSQLDAYQLLHTSNMVGLFSCIFVRSTLRNKVRGISSGEVKRGLGGLHGNKGALIIRFILEDSSLCFTNCHLAAGQSQTVNRNEDATAILEAAVLPRETDLDARTDVFIGGGDGSMIIDHEICVLNGDLNYRIDTMSRETVIKAVNSGNLTKLLERDQLLMSKRRNPVFRLRAFNEQPIDFAPTYKYDVGTDRYDTSEKSRSPAWCDRVLYRGVGRIKPIGYRRHEVRVSDHRPVSSTFKMRIKSIIPERRKAVWEACEKRLEDVRLRLARDTKMDYLVNVLGVGQKEASRLIRQ